MFDKHDWKLFKSGAMPELGKWTMRIILGTLALVLVIFAGSYALEKAWDGFTSPFRGAGEWISNIDPWPFNNGSETSTETTTEDDGGWFSGWGSDDDAADVDTAIATPTESIPVPAEPVEPAPVPVETASDSKDESGLICRKTGWWCD